MEKNELSRIPDPDVVVSPDDPDDPVVSTDYVEKKREKPMFNRLGTRKAFPQWRNDLESSSCEHENHQPNDTKIVIKQLEEILGASLNNIHEPVSHIYKVPKDLRNIDIKAYTPRVISIGPFHHGKTSLSEMEKHKVRYMSEFLKRKDAKKLKEFIKIIEDNKPLIRDRYQEDSSLKCPEFVKMILLDAVFIIEYFLKSTKLLEEREFDFFLDAPYTRAVITRDLQLLENQLPYFLLKDLFEKEAFPNFTKEDYPNRDPFLILCHRFFCNSKNDVFPEPNDQIQHFTDLRRYFMLMDFLPQDQKQTEHVRDLPTATKLHWSGVKFKEQAEIEGGSSRKISCQYVSRAIRIPYFKSCRIPYFKTCELRIPSLEIDDWSECLFRNLMAIELRHYPYETHICNFILLMDCLINTKKDVDLLVDQGIISTNQLGGNINAAIAEMFNNLSSQITASPSVYHCLGKMLKEHYKSHGWVRFLSLSMATLKTVYFGDLWTATKTVAVLVLTFIQAVYSM